MDRNEPTNCKGSVLSSSVKLFGLIPKKQGISSQEFHDHYRHPHGTMGQSTSTLRHYSQSHQIHTDLLNEKQSRFEAVAELWLDNLDDVNKFREEPVIAKYIIDDEPRFIDMGRLEFLACNEEIIVSSPDARDKSRHPGDAMWSPFTRPSAVKILHCIEANGNSAWRTDEDKALGESIGVFRHIRCTPDMAFHGDQPPFLGVRELWWPTVTAFTKGVDRNPEAFARLIGNQQHSTTLLVVAERWH